MVNTLKELKQHRQVLTKQQYKTIKGQITAGDQLGALKGLNTILSGLSKL